MLKGRSKIFAPKKIGGGPRRPTPSSARPSVERQSQTPAPAAPPQVIDLDAEESRSVPTVEAQEAQTQRQAVAEETVTSETTNPPSTVRLKRKTRDDDAAAAQSPAKRRLSLDKPHLPTPQAEQSQTTTTTQPSSSSRLKRKTREDDASPAVAKRKPSPQRREAPPQTATLTPPGSTPASEPTKDNSVEVSKSVPAPDAPATEDWVRERDIAEDEDDRESQPPSPHRRATPEARGYRYPSPENMVTIADEPQTASTSLGPAGGNTSGLGAAGDVGAIIRPGQASEIVPMAALNPDGTSGGIIEEAPSASENEQGKKKKKTTKRTKKVQAAQAGDDVRATIEMQINRPRRIAGQKRERRKKDGEGRRRRQRAETPEGAEDEIIDHSTMTMTDLCKDLKIGRKFSKAAEIKDRILRKKVEAAKAKMRKDHPELIPIIDGDEGESSVGPAQAGPSGTADEPIEVPAASTSGPQLRIVDGQIVVDESTLQVDRHKNAEKDRGEMREIEENDFSRVITSGTYMKRERAQLWDHAGNDLFYKGLRMFGTDFEMIAKMFPHRNRRQIKLKFNKEEKDNPHRINKALMGVKEEIDLDEFEKIADIKLEEVSAIEAEHESYDQEERAKLDRHAAEVAETTRKKKEAIQSQNKSQRERVQAILATADDSDDEGGAVRGTDSAKENAEPARGQSREASAALKSKKKAAPRKPRMNKHSYRAGGEEVEILGTID